MLKVNDYVLFNGNTVREIQLHRPPVNALNAELLLSLQTALHNAEKTSAVGAVVLSGNGGVFSAGMDIKETARLSREDLTTTFQRLKDVTLAIGRYPLPIASAITGNCLGAGAIFSLFCDYRVMTKGRASFGITEIKGGMTIHPHVFYALSRIIGEHQAQQMILAAKVIDASNAMRIGLVDQLVNKPLVVSRAVAWCGRMLELPLNAMQTSRAISRTGITDMLLKMEALPIETRVDEWYQEGVQNTLKKLLKR